MLILVTGAAGFIGSQVSHALLRQGHSVVGIDNLNTYYSVKLKQARLASLLMEPGFSFHDLDISDHERLKALEQRDDVDRVIHLAAQAGVRYSIENPFAYASSNLVGHLSVLEFCRAAARKPLLAYASSSSVYGDGLTPPYREDASVDHPVSLYAATKRADELMSESYAHLYGLQQVGMRFFTVYGPWGRPDMAYWSFTKNILSGEPIKVFNNGKMRRDFTYIDDAVSGVISIATQAPQWSASAAPHKIYNIGHNEPISLMSFIELIEEISGIRAVKQMLPMQPGDVMETCADISRMQADYGYLPQTPIKAGLTRFIEWFRSNPSAF